MSHQKHIDRVSRVIKGSRTSSCPVNGQILQPLTTPLHFAHYCPSVSKSGETAIAYPQKVEYVYVYTTELKREVGSIGAEIQALKAASRLRDAELQRDIAQMKLRIEQMRRPRA
ncbi:hypothetical protein FPOAC1_005408 [Fusarium poae]|jgi:hypothetical protein|uniref:hypothetical protein n=1 Tax=Fusarium poae TaxID=36050 RepID=UPI001CEA85C3|nr:hypothetical protein FPOAC1_005408 [Fusarium poae]KAG8672147.1 hypothetical protein FPOAC1_005408 [Fusarium poae]